MTLPFSTDW